MPVTLKPKHKQWVENQGFGLSEWIRNRIDEEIEKETHVEGEHHDKKVSAPPEEEKEDKEKEEGSRPDRICDVCGEREGAMEVTKNGETSYICKECMESSSNPTCEMCEMNEAVERVPMGPGRDKMWLCETCMQEEGFRQARKC